MKKAGFILSLLVCLTGVLFGQNFTTSASGAWTTGSNWSGGTAPNLTSQGWGTVTINHDMTITGDYTVPNSTVNISAGKTLTITGNLSVAPTGGGNAINVSGVLQVNGDITLKANLNILPGGKVIVNGNMTVVSSNYLTVGTNVAPPSYADLVIKQNLVSQSGGDVLVDKNGRMAVYGNFTNNTSGGSGMTINSGGMVYINGNINLTAGGNTIANSNPSSPASGLYVNGTTTNPSSTTTTNKADKAAMQSSNPTFSTWVAAQPNSPLPVTLLFFSVKEILKNGIVLTWATSSELNFDFFEVQSSSDGLSFKGIGRINGNGNSVSRHDYSFEDKDPLIGKNYYRLKTVDTDGFTEYFNVVSADFYAEKQAGVYPNPSDGKFITAKINFQHDQEYSIAIYNSFGLMIENYTSRQSEVELTFTNTLPSGVYYAKFSSPDYNQTIRFLVR